MLLAAISLFVIAAFFGAYVLVHILQDKPTPKSAVFIHGGIASLALIIIAYVSYLNPHPWLIASLIIFVLAATGGFYLFGLDMNKRPLPKIVAIIHPLAAVIGLLVLVIYALKSV